MAGKTPARSVQDASGIHFEATVRRVRDRSIVRLPDDASARLPSRGQVAVTGAMNGHPFQTVVEPDGTRGHWLEIQGKTAESVAVGYGDTVAIEMDVTKDWPEPDLPKDFQAALADAPDVSELWNDITPMARWEWVRWINATKNPHTRNRRIEVGISKLRSGKRRPCCFDLAACTDPDLSTSGKLVVAL